MLYPYYLNEILGYKKITIFFINPISKMLIHTFVKFDVLIRNSTISQF